jgi:hypothetical protein
VEVKPQGPRRNRQGFLVYPMVPKSKKSAIALLKEDCAQLILTHLGLLSLNKLHRDMVIKKRIALMPKICAFLMTTTKNDD